MNSLNVIVPYRWQGTWVFDDNENGRGLIKEPFVSGADKMIDVLVAGIPDADSGFKLIFSANPFPNHQLAIDWKREESGWNSYYSSDYDVEGFLCPSLMKYFDDAPSKIFVKAEQI
jgi:hypothetical protein